MIHVQIMIRIRGLTMEQSQMMDPVQTMDRSQMMDQTNDK